MVRRQLLLCATEADRDYNVRFSERGFLDFNWFRTSQGLNAKLYLLRDILRIARQKQLARRPALKMDVVRGLCDVLGIVYGAERKEILMGRVAAVLRREM